MGNEKIAKIIEGFLDRKKEVPLEKLYKDAVKALGDKIEKSSEDEALKVNAKRIIDAKRSKEKSALDNQKHKFNELLSLEFANSTITDTIKLSTLEQIANLEKKFQPTQWIDDAALKVSGVVLEVTHIAKLTHSSAKASNINTSLYQSQVDKPILVTANCAAKLEMDFAYSTAEYAPVAEFLQFKWEGKILGKIICDEPSVLKPFAQDADQLKQWQEQFGLAFNEKHKSTHELLKQVYFPVAAGYHLLTPLVSSSLAQIIHGYIWQTRQENMLARKARKERLFFHQNDVLYTKTAILKVTQTNHQNVSNLNGKRSGQLMLLRAVPPQWQSQPKLPIAIKTIFNKELAYVAKTPFENLKDLLLAIKLNDLSLNMQRKQHIAELLTEIADVVFDYVTQLHRLSQYQGWSEKSKLLIHQQYWLDPCRTDKDFQDNRNAADWETSISQDFAQWVNWRLRHPKLTLGVAHEKHWRKLFIPLLRKFNAISDSTLDDNMTTSKEQPA
ncbi:type I-F CRISPR-associated protein Csy1 [Nitrosomonas sp. Is37]|uniref:type I-F CRISPR-associated protein Csy1 n=1 Tax=Nitrosomonas sp. Is37 TaxID=3080535 RepID=UPI00294B16CE|nr:type I-F CRISPR-associated protein Csy1 [Nitrosomonas sp. Is37]MDV6343162.1 type I-F CRISPR-associated protein Csy1 [Nitrosomonas sp. Is37]